MISDKVLKDLGELGTARAASPAPEPVANAIAFARFTDGRFGWNVVDPGHGLVFATTQRPADAAAAAPLSGAAPTARCCSSTDANALPAALQDYLLDIQPGYDDDPVRGVYNHGWMVGDEAAISIDVQSRIDALLEIQPVQPSRASARSAMAKPSSPSASRRDVTVDDVRQLMGASTPHFALQLRNRIRTLIRGLPPQDPARLARASRRSRGSSALGFTGELRGEPAQDGQRSLPLARRRRAAALRRGPDQRVTSPGGSAGAGRRLLRFMLARSAPRRHPRQPPVRAVARRATTPRRCATGCAASRACRCSARSSASRSGGRRCGSSCATARGALPCSMWRKRLGRARARHARPTAPGRGRGRRLRLLPRLARVLAVVLLRGHRSCASPARATCSPRSSGCAGARRRGAVRAAEAPAAAVAAAHDRRRLRRGRQGARRRAGRPAPPRLGRDGSCGRSRRCRTATPRPRSRARCRTSPRCEEVEVIVVARGGGSLADLFAFCDETLCRTVALLRVPVISSVGHHTDRTLIDDVAAVACSTPTHAAEAAVPRRLRRGARRAARARRAAGAALAAGDRRARARARAALARARRPRRPPPHAPAPARARAARDRRAGGSRPRRAARRPPRSCSSARPRAAAGAEQAGARARPRAPRARARRPRAPAHARARLRAGRGRRRASRSPRRPTRAQHAELTLRLHDGSVSVRPAPYGDES